MVGTFVDILSVLDDQVLGIIAGRPDGIPIAICISQGIESAATVTRHRITTTRSYTREPS